MAGLLISGCSSTPAASPTPDLTVIAQVGPVSITENQLDIRLHSVQVSIQQGGGPTPGNATMTTQLRATILQSLIADAVIAQEAGYRHVAATDADVDADVAKDRDAAGGQASLDSQLASVGGSVEQLRDEIRSRINEQNLEDLFAKARAADAITALARGGKFSDVATQVSDDTLTNTKGGDLGVVTQAQLDAGDAAFKAAVLAVPAGHTSPAAVRDVAGYEILHTVAVTAAGRHVLRILVAAPQPYTVKERPEWFSTSVLLALSNLCQAGSVHILLSNMPPACPTPTPPVPSPTHS